MINDNKLTNNNVQSSKGGAHKKGANYMLVKEKLCSVGAFNTNEKKKRKREPEIIQSKPTTKHKMDRKS